MNTKHCIQILLASILLCVLPVLNTNAQWVKKSNSGVSPNGKLSYPHPSAAYCSHNGNNGGGEIYKSVDSGDTWQMIHDFGSFTNTEHILFLNADTGFVQQYHRMYRTFDGGQSWQAMPDLFALAFAQSFIRTLKNIDNTLYISAARGDTSFVFQSVDYGSSFNIIYQNIEPNAKPLYVSFYTNNNAIVIHPGNDSTLFITHNQMATFDTVTYYNARLASERVMTFVDSNHGFFYGNTGALSFPSRLLKQSTGRRMDHMNLDVTGILPAIDMELGLQQINGRVYACSEYGKIFWSSNYGQNWNEQTTPVNATVGSIAFANENLGIAVASDGIILTKNGGAAPNSVINQELSNDIVLYPNPTTDEIFIEYKRSKGIEKISLYNSMGQTIKVLDVDTKKVQLSGLSKGYYFIAFETAAGRAVKKFIKR